MWNSVFCAYKPYFLMPGHISFHDIVTVFSFKSYAIISIASHLLKCVAKCCCLYRHNINNIAPVHGKKSKEENCNGFHVT